MRATIHIVSAREFWRYSAGVRAARREWLLRIDRKVDEAAYDDWPPGRARALADGPQPTKELGELAAGTSRDSASGSTSCGCRRRAPGSGEGRIASPSPSPGSGRTTRRRRGPGARRPGLPAGIRPGRPARCQLVGGDQRHGREGRRRRARARRASGTRPVVSSSTCPGRRCPTPTARAGALPAALGREPARPRAPHGPRFPRPTGPGSSARRTRSRSVRSSWTAGSRAAGRCAMAGSSSIRTRTSPHGSPARSSASATHSRRSTPSGGGGAPHRPNATAAA